MVDEILSLPSPSRGDDTSYVELSSTGEYKVFRKKILPLNGSFVHPADSKTKIFVNKEMAESLKKNFDRLDFPVQVPIVNDSNQHVEDPLRNAGVVTGIDYDDTGVYATFEARKYAEDFGKTILGASAFMHLNYMDTATGERVGPTLLHVAATNRPHVNGLGNFEEILKASADISDEQQILFMEEDTTTPAPEEETPVAEQEVVVEPKTEEVSPEPIDEDGLMTTDEMIAALKSDGIDVEALQAQATEAVELSAKLEAATQQLSLSGDAEVSVDDLANAIVELSSTNKSLTDDVEQLKLSNQTYVKREAEHEVDGLVKAGRVLPAQRDVMVELSLSNRQMFDALVPDKAIVSLSETGVTTHDAAAQAEERSALVAEYANRAKSAK